MIARVTRRDFSVSVVSLIGVGSAIAAGADVTKTAESIHQEVFFQSSRKRIYNALTDAKQFTAVTAFSTVKDAAPAQISAVPGGAFTLFGGYIVGRMLELVPDQRIVQAWRSADWDGGIYSIAKFELRDQGGRCLMVFDHTGFPLGEGPHLEEGWSANYWEPLKRYLS